MESQPSLRRADTQSSHNRHSISRAKKYDPSADDLDVKRKGMVKKKSQTKNPGGSSTISMRIMTQQSTRKVLTPRLQDYAQDPEDDLVRQLRHAKEKFASPKRACQSTRTKICAGGEESITMMTPKNGSTSASPLLIAANALSKRGSPPTDGKLMEEEEEGGTTSRRRRRSSGGSVGSTHNDDWRTGAIDFQRSVSCCSSSGMMMRMPAGLTPAAIRMLGLTPSAVFRVQRKWRRLEGHQAGLTVDGFFEALDCNPVPINRLIVHKIVFNWCDLDGDGKLDFGDFLFTACVLCTLTKEEILNFIFNLFDTNHNGYIDHAEFERFIDATGQQKKLADAYESFLDVNSTSAHFEATTQMAFESFTKINERFPGVLYPVLNLRETLTAVTLPQGDWDDMLEAFKNGPFCSKSKKGFHAQLLECGWQNREKDPKGFDTGVYWTNLQDHLNMTRISNKRGSE